MTIHIRIPEYDCKKCQTPFMAYSKGLGCPKCGQVEESNGEGYDFIDSQACALLVHRNMYNRFTPHGWYFGSYCDSLQWIIFEIFDHRENNPDQNWEDKIKEINLLDNNEQPFKNEKHLINLFNAIDEKFKIELANWQVEEGQRIANKEWRKPINRLKRYFKKIVKM